MFVRHQVHIEHPVSEAKSALMRSPDSWLPAAHTVGDDWRRLLARVGFGPPGLHLSKEVRISVGVPQHKRDWLDIPITWQATGPSGLFPIMEGHLTLEPVDRDTSRLSFSGSYQAPLGAVGQQLDTSMMHSLAEATVRDLVEHIAGRVSGLVETGPPTA